MDEHDTIPTRRILIAGGSGLIGRALTTDLAADGYEVVILSRSPAKMSGLPSGARAEGWDGETAAGWGQLADGALGIINLAGESIADGPWTKAKKERIVSSRLAPTRAVVAAVAEAEVKPAFLLQGSAVGFYGSRGDEMVDETAAAGDSFLADVSVRWEAASAPVEELGVRRCLLRTGIVLAQKDGALPKMALPFKMYVGGPLGSGTQYVPWIHLTDEVRAIRFLAESEAAQGPFNLTAPNPVTNRQLSQGIADALGRPNLLRAPRLALHMALGDMADMLLEGQRAVPAALEALGFRFRFPDLGAALADLLRKI